MWNVEGEVGDGMDGMGWDGMGWDGMGYGEVCVLLLLKRRLIDGCLQ